jgi:hypothetical protein
MMTRLLDGKMREALSVRVRARKHGAGSITTQLEYDGATARRQRGIG